MPVYEFRCADAHVHEAVLAIDSDQRSMPCRTCGAAAARLISAPGLSRLGSTRARLIEKSERSAHEPAVVEGIPRGRRSTPVSRDPRHAKLPRP